MAKKKSSRVGRVLEEFSRRVTVWSGSSWAFVVAFSTIIEGASNRLIDVEDLSEEEVETLHKHYQELGRALKSKGKLRESHSLEDHVARKSAKKS